MVEKKKERSIAVVKELPSQQVRTVTDNEGNEVDLITIEEAITEILENTRATKKSVA